MKLRDGVTVRVEDADKEFVFAISKRFDVDEVEGLVLLRSFLYNEGLPETAASAGSVTIVEELLDAITPFYYSERLYVLRILIPLFRANAGGVQPVSDIAVDLLPAVIPYGKAFATSLLAEYVLKSKARLPSSFDADPRKAVSWAKQNVKEQLVIQEVLFWTVWDYAPCDGQLVAQIYETSYQTNLGSHQENSTLLLDEEGTQLQQDMAALWILISVEVLELERAADPGGIEVSHTPEDKEIYWSSPASLERIHELVTSHPDSQFACQYIAWAFVLSRIVEVCTNLKELPSSYSKFFDSIMPTDRSYTRERDPAHVLMSRAALGQDAGLFQLMLTLLTNSPVFVTSMAWRTASSVTDPNAVAYRSVLKGQLPVTRHLARIHTVFRRPGYLYRRAGPGRVDSRFRQLPRGLDFPLRTERKPVCVRHLPTVLAVRLASWISPSGNTGRRSVAVSRAKQAPCSLAPCHDGFWIPRHRPPRHSRPQHGRRPAYPRGSCCLRTTCIPLPRQTPYLYPGHPRVCLLRFPSSLREAVRTDDLYICVNRPDVH